MTKIVVCVGFKLEMWGNCWVCWGGMILVSKGSGLIGQHLTLGVATIKVFTASESQAFLNAFKAQNSSLIPHMPWLAFPNVSPESSAWRQGDTERWFDPEWRPYWKALDDAQKTNILQGLKQQGMSAWYERLAE